MRTARRRVGACARPCPGATFDAMDASEWRAFRTASVVLLALSCLRWVGEARRPAPSLPPTPDTAAGLLEAARTARNDADARARPLGPEERLDPNTASARELDRLPGVGPAAAEAIVRAREEEGPFAGPEDLRRARGVGEATVRRIAPLLEFGAGGGRVGSGGRIAPRGRVGATPGRGGAAGAVAGAVAGPRPGGRGNPAPSRIDVNRADAAALQSLPGIGPALAERILAARRERPFRDVDDLLRVPGIGPATLERLRARVSAGGKAPL